MSAQATTLDVSGSPRSRRWHRATAATQSTDPLQRCASQEPNPSRGEHDDAGRISIRVSNN
ncbi:hypothetical protein C2845_PM05G08360 [Panicum miliaceum]|uniref:Uncharacterized protein n=1 Tax=Panicum miliaceum TaxID=4540 RepID=A0A3L6T2D6_PANMI|nr:hypothetical protein C2845_PM05G08360 [Panicum miliaceum]